MTPNVELLLNWICDWGGNSPPYTYTLTKDCPIIVAFGMADNSANITLTSSTGNITTLDKKSVRGYCENGIHSVLIQNAKSGDKISLTGGKLSEFVIYSLGKGNKVLATKIGVGELPTNTTFTVDTTKTVYCPSNFDVVMSVTAQGEMDEINHVLDTVPGNYTSSTFAHGGHDGYTNGALITGFLKSVKGGDALNFGYENKAWADSSSSYEYNIHTTSCYGFIIKSISVSIGDNEIDSVFIGDNEIDSINIGDNEI